MPDQDRNFLALFEGQRGWDRKAQTYKPSDDGVHIEDSNEQWEWWYFDFSFENGYKAVATLHYHNMMIVPHFPTMQLFVYPPDTPPKVRLWGLKPGEINLAAKDRCCVKMGQLSAEDTGNGYHLFMDMKDLGIDVIIRNVVPPWKAGTGVLWSDPQTGEETGWIVSVPRGSAQGTLTFDGKTTEVEGSAYHDHNYGNCPMEAIFSGWCWGRLFDPAYTLIYGWVMPREDGRPVVSPLMLAKGPDIVLSTDMMILTVEEFRVDEKYGFDLPMRLKLECNGPGVKVDCQLFTETVVESLELPRGKSFYHYYRFLAKYEGRFNVDGKEEIVSGETLHETMFLD